MIYVYNITTGYLWGSFSESFQADANTYEGCAQIELEGSHNISTHKLDLATMTIIDDDTLITADEAKSRRAERTNEFAKTIDILNPIRYEELDEADKISLKDWRQDWLDYPATGVKPEIHSAFL